MKVSTSSTCRSREGAGVGQAVAAAPAEHAAGSALVFLWAADASSHLLCLFCPQADAKQQTQTRARRRTQTTLELSTPPSLPGNPEPLQPPSPKPSGACKTWPHLPRLLHHNVVILEPQVEELPPLEGRVGAGHCHDLGLLVAQVRDTVGLQGSAKRKDMQTYADTCVCAGAQQGPRQGVSEHRAQGQSVSTSQENLRGQSASRAFSAAATSDKHRQKVCHPTQNCTARSLPCRREEAVNPPVP